MLELHLIRVKFIPHDLDEDEMVVIFGDSFVGHAVQLRKLRKLGRCQYPFAPNTTLTVKQP